MGPVDQPSHIHTQGEDAHGARGARSGDARDRGEADSKSRPSALLRIPAARRGLPRGRCAPPHPERALAGRPVLRPPPVRAPRAGRLGRRGAVGDPPQQPGRPRVRP